MAGEESPKEGLLPDRIELFMDENVGEFAADLLTVLKDVAEHLASLVDATDRQVAVLQKLLPADEEDEP